MTKLKSDFKHFFFAASVSFTLMLLIYLPPGLAAPALNSALPGEIGEINDDIDLSNANKNNGTHIVATTLESTFKADNSTIWNVLVDFKKYPAIFKRIKSVDITKSDDGLVYMESHLKPGLFVQRIVQHTVVDLKGGPTTLKWSMLDGNFKYLKGKWELSECSPNTCKVKYTLYVDVGPVIPAVLVNFAVHHMQQEIVSDLKRYVETQFPRRSRELR